MDYMEHCGGRDAQQTTIMVINILYVVDRPQYKSFQSLPDGY